MAFGNFSQPGNGRREFTQKELDMIRDLSNAKMASLSQPKTSFEEKYPGVQRKYRNALDNISTVSGNFRQTNDLVQNVVMDHTISDTFSQLNDVKTDMFVTSAKKRLKRVGDEIMDKTKHLEKELFNARQTIAEKNVKTENLEETKSRLHSEILDAERAIELHRETVSRYAKYLKQYEEKHAAFGIENQSLKAKLAELEADIKEKEVLIDALTADRTSLGEEIANIDAIPKTTRTPIIPPASPTAAAVVPAPVIQTLSPDKKTRTLEDKLKSMGMDINGAIESIKNYFEREDLVITKDTYGEVVGMFIVPVSENIKRFIASDTVPNDQKVHFREKLLGSRVRGTASEKDKVSGGTIGILYDTLKEELRKKASVGKTIRTAPIDPATPIDKKYVETKDWVTPKKDIDIIYENRQVFDPSYIKNVDQLLAASTRFYNYYEFSHSTAFNSMPVSVQSVTLNYKGVSFTIDDLEKIAGDIAMKTSSINGLSVWDEKFIDPFKNPTYYKDNYDDDTIFKIKIGTRNTYIVANLQLLARGLDAAKLSDVDIKNIYEYGYKKHSTTTEKIDNSIKIDDSVRGVTYKDRNGIMFTLTGEYKTVGEKKSYLAKGLDTKRSASYQDVQMEVTEEMLNVANGKTITTPTSTTPAAGTPSPTTASAIQAGPGTTVNQIVNVPPTQVVVNTGAIQAPDTRDFEEAKKMKTNILAMIRTSRESDAKIEMAHFVHLYKPKGTWPKTDPYKVIYKELETEYDKKFPKVVAPPVVTPPPVAPPQPPLPPTGPAPVLEGELVNPSLTIDFEKVLNQQNFDALKPELDKRLNKTNASTEVYSTIPLPSSYYKLADHYKKLILTDYTLLRPTTYITLRSSPADTDKWIGYFTAARNTYETDLGYVVARVEDLKRQLSLIDDRLLDAVELGKKTTYIAQLSDLYAYADTAKRELGKYDEVLGRLRDVRQSSGVGQPITQKTGGLWSGTKKVAKLAGITAGMALAGLGAKTAADMYTDKDTKIESPTKAKVPVTDPSTLISNKVLIGDDTYTLNRDTMQTIGNEALYLARNETKNSDTLVFKTNINGVQTYKELSPVVDVVPLDSGMGQALRILINPEKEGWLVIPKNGDIIKDPDLGKKLGDAMKQIYNGQPNALDYIYVWRGQNITNQNAPLFAKYLSEKAKQDSQKLQAQQVTAPEVKVITPVAEEKKDGVKNTNDNAEPLTRLASLNSKYGNNNPDYKSVKLITEGMSKESVAFLEKSVEQILVKMFSKHTQST